MSAKPPAASFMYVETDIPPGITIHEWRAQRAAERATQRRAERGARWQRSRMRLLFGALMRCAAGALLREERERTARCSVQRGVNA